MTAIAQVLEDAGFDTFLPHRDGLKTYMLCFSNTPFASRASGIRTRVDHAIFCLDVYELVQRCDAVVCSLNGRVPDEGMIVEAALAYAAGRPLVLFKNDVRAPFGGYDNSMLTSLVQGKIVRRLGDLPAALRDAMARKTEPAPLAGDLLRAASRGRRISSLLESLPGAMPRKKWDRDVIDRVLEESLIEE